MLKGTKLQKVLIKCLNTDQDGHPVDRYGEIANHSRRYFYTWEIRRRSNNWLLKNPTAWKSIK